MKSRATAYALLILGSALAIPGSARAMSAPNENEKTSTFKYWAGVFGYYTIRYGVPTHQYCQNGTVEQSVADAVQYAGKIVLARQCFDIAYKNSHQMKDSWLASKLGPTSKSDCHFNRDDAVSVGARFVGDIVNQPVIRVVNREYKYASSCWGEVPSETELQIVGVTAAFLTDALAHSGLKALDNTFNFTAPYFKK